MSLFYIFFYHFHYIICFSTYMESDKEENDDSIASTRTKSIEKTLKP